MKRPLGIYHFPIAILTKRVTKCTERTDIIIKTNGIEDKPFIGYYLDQGSADEGL